MNKGELALEAYKYSRGIVGKTISSSTAIVLAFGVSLIGFHLNGKEIVKNQPYDFTAALILSIIFVSTWAFYFKTIHHFENIMNISLKFVNKNEIAPEKEIELIQKSYSKNLKYVPFWVSFFFYILIIQPFK